MYLHSLATPAFLLDMDILEKNISTYAALAKANAKRFYPMTKTSKSTHIVRMQARAGVDGFLAGTVYEAEALAQFKKPIMLAYPAPHAANLTRIAAVMRETQVILSLDTLAVAKAYQRFFQGSERPVPYLLLVDVGLHRLGVQPALAAPTVQQIKEECPALHFLGIAAHPGQVYGCTSPQEVAHIVQEENEIFLEVASTLCEAGFAPDIRATGATPTFRQELQLPGFNALRPGNYVFHDLSQIALGVAEEEDCALTVLASIISRPASDLFIMDCGSKCLALDRGAHGNAFFSGHGRVLHHPELVVESLSEEVGKLRILGKTTLSPGDRIRILPNHACPVANLANCLTGIREDTVECTIPINMGN